MGADGRGSKQRNPWNPCHPWSKKSAVTKDGKQTTGLVLGETGEKVELLLPDAKRVTFAKSDIEESKLQDISPMPAGLVKQPDELRDLLAFLLSE